MKQAIIFIGPEGSGKTINSVKLARELEVPYISTGDIIRELAANDFTTKYGEMCRKMFENRGYLDGNTLLEILTERIRQNDTREGFVLDGGMRTVEETEKFPESLARARRDDLPIKIIFLKIPIDTTFQRLTGKNGRNRHDDTVERLTKRLESFYSTLEQRLKIIQNNNWELREVDANLSIDEVYKKVSEEVMH